MEVIYRYSLLHSMHSHTFSFAFLHSSRAGHWPRDTVNHLKSELFALSETQLKVPQSFTSTNGEVTK